MAKKIHEMTKKKNFKTFFCGFLEEKKKNTPSCEILPQRKIMHATMDECTLVLF
jgi:hypothetical protein